MLDVILRQPLFRMVDDIVNTTEMVHRLHNIIHIDRIVSNANGVSLKDIACLVVGQTATLDMVGVIGQVDLRSMIDAAFQSGCFLFPKCLQQR